MDFAKTARNLAVADIALAFARDRVARMVPGVQPRKRRPGLKTLLIGGGLRKSQPRAVVRDSG